MDKIYDLSLWIGIISVIVTIVVGVLSTYFSKNHVQISFILERVINLFNTLSKYMPELSIYYKKAPIKQKLVLIEGSFINTGKSDIIPSIVDKPLTLSLPEDYVCLEAKLRDCSNNINAHVNIINHNILEINSGLFKKGEYIRFQALLETPGGQYPSVNNISISHRIANLDIIKDPLFLRFRLNKKIILLLIVVYFTLLPMLFYESINASKDIYYGRGNAHLFYSFITPENEKIEVTLEPLATGNIEVKGIKEPFWEIIPLKEVNRRGIIAGIRVNKFKYYTGIVILPILFLFLIIANYFIGKLLIILYFGAKLQSRLEYKINV